MILRIENIVEKVEIAHYEQFLLLPQCLQKSSDADTSESVGKLERVNPFPHTVFLTPLL